MQGVVYQIKLSKIWIENQRWKYEFCQYFLLFVSRHCEWIEAIYYSS